MAWTTHVLVVANKTAGSAELVRALQERAASGPVAFTLLMPTDRAHRGGAAVLAKAVELCRAVGLTVEGQLGDSDPIVAVSDLWSPRRFDEIVVCTLPAGVSRWLRWGLLRRIEQMTDTPVAHVAVREESPAAVAYS